MSDTSPPKPHESPSRGNQKGDPNKSSLDELSFEEALLQLETSVRHLEAGTLPLEEAIAAFEHGMRLSDHCQKKLQEATLKVETITKRQAAGGGQPGADPAPLQRGSSPSGHGPESHSDVDGGASFQTSNGPHDGAPPRPLPRVVSDDDPWG